MSTFTAPRLPHMLLQTLLRIGSRLATYLAVQVVVLIVTESPTWAAVSGAAATVLMYRMGRTSMGVSPGRLRIPRSATLVLWLIGLVPVWLTGQAAALWICQTWPSLAAGYEAHVETLSLSSRTLALALTIAVAPVAEELLMRGVVYRELRHTLGLSVPLAAVLSSTVFAAMHANLVQASATFTLGVFLAFAFEYTHSIIVPIVLHAAFNLASTFVPVSAVAGFAQPAIFVSLFVVVMGGLGLVYVIRRRCL